MTQVAYLDVGREEVVLRDQSAAQTVAAQRHPVRLQVQLVPAVSTFTQQANSHSQHVHTCTGVYYSITPVRKNTRTVSIFPHEVHSCINVLCLIRPAMQPVRVGTRVQFMTTKLSKGRTDGNVTQKLPCFNKQHGPKRMKCSAASERVPACPWRSSRAAWTRSCRCAP